MLNSHKLSIGLAFTGIALSFIGHSPLSRKPALIPFYPLSQSYSTRLHETIVCDTSN